MQDTKVPAWEQDILLSKSKDPQVPLILMTLLIIYSLYK